MIPKLVTVAGSDSSGGAGIAADLKTFIEYGTYGFSAITSIVTMDPNNNWSHSVTPMDAKLVEEQLETIYAGSPITALKTGMLGDIKTIEVVRKYIDKFDQQNVVIDPVMACKGTTEVLQPENVEKMTELLLPVATITTPNLLEAGILSGLGELSSIEDMKKAAEKIIALGPKNVVVKGGKRIPGDKAVDIFYDGNEFTLLENDKYHLEFEHGAHGAGCTFAAAITAGLGKGMSVKEAVIKGKEFASAGIRDQVTINPFIKHVWHGAYHHAENRMES